MNILIKAHKTYYPVDASSLWYSPTSRRWHGYIVGVGGYPRPFMVQTHGGPMDTNRFSALRDEFIVENVNAADICPFCGMEFGKHKLDVRCPCPPKKEHKTCPHPKEYVSFDFQRDINICRICGETLGGTYLQPSKACEHKNKAVETWGHQYFSGGELVDSLRDILVCKDCGKELDSESKISQEIP